MLKACQWSTYGNSLDVVVESEVVGKQRASGATEAVGEDHNVLWREHHSRFDAVSEVATAVEVHQTGVVSELATADVRDAREEVAGVIVGDMRLCHIVVVSRAPQGSGHSSGGSRGNQFVCKLAQRKVFRPPAIIRQVTR